MKNVLVVDIGNTATKIGWYKADVLQQLIAETAIDAILDTNDFETAIIAESGSNTFFVEKLVKKNIRTIRVNAALKLPFQLLYKTPESLGADRIAAVAAAVEKAGGKAVLVITAGTCFTYNLLNEKKEFLGGAIAPGFNMRLQAMHTFTKKLPEIAFDKKLPNLIGNNTTNAMQSGAVNGAIMEIEQMINAYAAQYKDLQIVITGGDAEFIQANVKKNIFLQPNLIIEGLYTILRHNE